jgi:hypothetical protein
MFEDFRKQIDDSSFTDEDQTEGPLKTKIGDTGYFLGLSPAQRFMLALMVLIITILLGVLFLLVTSKIVPPSMY